MTWVRRISAGLALIILIIFVAAWFLLSSEVFRSMRTEFVETRLTTVMKHPIEIDGDIAISFFPKVTLDVSGMRVPAADYSDPDIAFLESARFTLAPLTYLRGGLPLPEMQADGLKISVILHPQEISVPLDSEDPAANDEKEETDAPDNTAPVEQPQAEAAKRKHFDLFTFLGHRQVDFTNSELSIENKLTGFEFDFKLGDLSIDQVDGGTRAVVTTHGSVNGETFEASGSFPDAGPYDVSGSVAGVRFTLDGETSKDDPEGQFEGDLTIETSDLQGFLDALKLKGTVSGAGKLHSRLSHSNGRYAFDDLNLELDFNEGKGVVLSGLFRQQEAGADIDLMLDIDLAGDAQIDQAVLLKDIKPLRLTAHIVGQGREIELRDFDVLTNAFDRVLKEIGPIRVGRIVRTTDGELQLQDLELNIGPRNRPFVVANGDVGDLLSFSGYTLDALLDVPIAMVLTHFDTEIAQKFGRLTGEGHVADVDGKAVLSNLVIQSTDTDLWEGKVDFSIGDIEELEGMKLAFRMAVENSGALFEAAGLTPHSQGPFRLSFDADSNKRRMALGASVTVAQSTIDARINSRVLAGAPVVRGSIESDELRLEDLRQAFLNLQELAGAWNTYTSTGDQDEPEETGSADTLVQPLVLPETPETATSQEDLSEFQPLVLSAQDTGNDGAGDSGGDETDVQPLVVDEDLGDLTLEEIKDPKLMARRADVELGIDIRKLSGQKGISQIKSELEIEQGQLRFGPLRLDYAGGYANLNAGLNFINSPDRLRISGQTGGWNLGEILDSVGAGIGAYGILTGSFDLSGRYQSVRAYATTMRGQATVRLQDGRISTSLIDLAGLGVLPWLFSKELRQGYADIVCVRAPLRFNDGRIDTKATVLETERVQLVAAGYADLNSEQVALRAEPRPVGRPLARSALPFEISGSLTDPKFSIGPRKKRTARVPLTMAQNRTPCVPDVGQLQSPDDGLRGGGRK